MLTHRHVHVRIEGRVQGVGFRMFVAREAERHGVVGMVRNRRDGGVEAFLSGVSDAIDALLVAVRCGPRGARVDLWKVFACDDHAWRSNTRVEIGATV